MGYTKEQAHEYYMEYVKKGKKKGREKGKSKKKSGSKKKGTTTKLLALSSSGLNENGKIEFAFMKEKLTSEMNSALSKAKTAEEKENIRREYQKKALKAVDELKANKEYASEKKSSTKGSSAKSGGSGKSSGGSGSSKSGSSSSTAVKQVSDTVQKLSSELDTYSAEKKEAMRTAVNSFLTALKSVNPNQMGALLKQFNEVVKRL